MKTKLITAALAVLLSTGVAFAEYPEKPITLVVGASAGGGTDIQTRILAERLSDVLGQQVIVDNRPGAGSNIASTFVKAAKPDGYTFTMIGPAFVINDSLYVDPGFDATDDFVAVAGWAKAPLFFVVNPDLPVSTLQELADYSQAHPNELDYGNGIGFINMMVMELFKIEANADIQFVPYPGMAPARTDVLGGQIETTVDSVASSGSFVESGALRALAVSSDARLERFPDVPTVAEAGFPGVTNFSWYGVMAPKGTPQDILDKVGNAVVAILAEDGTIEKIAAGSATPLVAGPAEFQTFVGEQVDVWAKVIKESGLELVQ